MPPPMPVTMPISAAGARPRPYSAALTAPVTQNSASPKASKTLTERSIRPSVGWNQNVSRPAATGAIR